MNVQCSDIVCLTLRAFLYIGVIKLCMSIRDYVCECEMEVEKIYEYVRVHSMSI